MISRPPLRDVSEPSVAETGRPMLDLEDLQTFVAVADAGGVSPAARRLGVSKSIVSRSLFRLESDLGVQLLARTTRGASLTGAGVVFREHAARVVAEIDVARETILPAGDLRGRLRIAAPLCFGPKHLAPVLAKLAKQHPLLQVQTAYSDRFVDLVAEGFDAAVRVGYLPDSLLAHVSQGFSGEKGRQQLTTTFEHLAIVGGFMFLIIHGAGGLSIDSWLR